MAACHDIDVLCAGPLQLKANFGKIRGGEGGSHSALRNLVILAERAAQVAASYKNRAGTTVHSDRWLFAKVKARARGSDFIGFSAKSRLPGSSVSPVRSAVSRAKVATLVKSITGHRGPLSCSSSM